MDHEEGRLIRCPDFAGRTNSLVGSDSILSERGVVFVKIPKVGSQSFWFTLRRWFEIESERLEMDFNLLSNGRANTLWPETHLAPRTGERTVWEVGGKVWPGQIEKLDGPKLHGLASHWPWGYDPDIYKRVMVSEQPITIAILRDPAERALSSYYYSLFRGKSGGFDKKAMVKKASIKDFSAWLSEYDTDYYARWFSWPNDQDSPDMAKAAENITSGLSVVGITEQYEDLVRYCHVAFGMCDEVRHANKTVDRFKGRKKEKYFRVDDLPDSVRQKLRQQTSKDRELYELATANFREKLSQVGASGT